MSKGCGNSSPQALEIIEDKYLYRIHEDGTREAINEAAEHQQESVDPLRVQTTGSMDSIRAASAS
jgi:hypothetical protein